MVIKGDNSMKLGRRISILILTILMTCTFFVSGVYAAPKPKEPAPVQQSLTGPSDSTVTFYRKTVTLPLKYSEFSKGGWKIKDKALEKEMLPQKSMSWVPVSHGKQSLVIIMYNFASKPMKMSQCYVIGILSEDANGTPTSAVKLSNGLTIGRSYDEVIAAYGEPDMQFEGEGELYLSYFDSGNRVTEMTVDLESSTVLRFSIQDKTHPNIDSAPLPGPEPMTGPSDSTMQIDGVTATFPMQYADFEALGWTVDLVPYEGSLCEPGCVYYMTGIKGDKTLGIQLYNFGTEPVPFTETVVVGMTNYDPSGLPDVHVVLSNGLSIGRTYDEVIAVYGSPVFTETGWEGITLSYPGPDLLDTRITFDFDLSKVIYFEVINLTGSAPLPEPDPEPTPEPDPDPMPNPGLEFPSATMQIDGDTVTFPIQFADLAALGWTIDLSVYEGLLCEPGSFIYVTGIKEDRTLGFFLSNLGPDPVPFTESVIIGMTTSPTGTLMANVVMSYGISTGSTYDEVIAVFGDPIYTESGPEGITIAYRRPDNVQIFITFDSEMSNVIFFTVIT